jgi:hypothetical protein
MEYAIFSLSFSYREKMGFRFTNGQTTVYYVFLMHHRSVHPCGILAAMSAPCGSPVRIKKEPTPKSKKSVGSVQ